MQRHGFLSWDICNVWVLFEEPWKDHLPHLSGPSEAFSCTSWIPTKGQLLEGFSPPDTTLCEAHWEIKTLVTTGIWVPRRHKVTLLY